MWLLDIIYSIDLEGVLGALSCAVVGLGPAIFCLKACK